MSMDSFPSSPSSVPDSNARVARIRDIIGQRDFDMFAGDDQGRFLGKVAANEEAMHELEQRPGFIFELSHYGSQVLDNPELFAVFMKHARQRHEAIVASERDLRARLLASPFATEEELSAGMNREGIEPQVRDAVFALRAKGYGTFESGFHDLRIGDQYLGFEKGALAGFVPGQEMVARLNELGVTLSIAVDAEDRDSLFLKPQRDISMVEWKVIWDYVAESFPDCGHPAAPSRLGDTLRERNANMRAGKRVYLGAGLFYENGAVVEAPNR